MILQRLEGKRRVKAMHDQGQSQKVGHHKVQWAEARETTSLREATVLTAPYRPSDGEISRHLF